MKKVWIGEGIAILLIIIASITAHKLLPDDRALPLGVFSACLCLFILAVTVTIIIIPSLFQEIKGTSRKRKKNLYCYTYDEKNEPLKVRVNEGKLDDVETTRFVGSYIYGSDDKYMLCYYENLKIFVDLQVLKVAPE